MQEEHLQAGCCRAESEIREIVKEHSENLLPESQTTIVTGVPGRKYF